MPPSERLVKYASGQKIEKAIRNAIITGELKSGDKLHGEGELSRIYGENIYSVRQALNRLKENGWLYSIPRNGVFVADRRREVQPASEKTAADSVSAVVRYATRSCLPAQQRFFENIQRSFHQTNGFTQMEMVYHEASAFEQMPKADVYEYSSNSISYIERNDLVDLQHYFNSAVRYPDKMIGNNGVALCHPVPVMICNCNLMKKYGLPLPEFNDFDSQREYLDAVTMKTAEISALKMPGSNQNMIFKLGSVQDEFLADVVNDDMDMRTLKDKYHDILRKCTAFWKKFHISYPGRSYLQEFINGETPFYFGFSAKYIMGSANEKFDTVAAVMFSHDDTVNCLTMLAAIDENSSQPVDAVRLVQHLQKDEFQQQWAKLGFAPLQEKDYHLMPYNNSRSIRLAPPLKFVSLEDYYVCMNIINPELWNIVLFEKDIDDALYSTVNFSRSYINMKMDRRTVKTRNEAGNIYR